MSPGILRSTNTRFCRSDSSKVGRPPVMNNCHPILKNETLSSCSTIPSASPTVGTSSATMRRSLPVSGGTSSPRQLQFRGRNRSASLVLLEVEVQEDARLKAPRSGPPPKRSEQLDGPHRLRQDEILDRCTAGLFISGVDEINVRGRTGPDAHGLRERPVALMPGLDLVLTGGIVYDFEQACSATHREIRVADNADIRRHPAVYVALDPDHDFFILQVKLQDHPGFGLADVEPVAAR